MSTEAPSVGPVDFFVIAFPGNEFKGEIAPAIQDLVDSGTIRVIDVLLAYKQGDEDVRVLELQEVPSEVFQRFEPMVGEITGLLTENDVRTLSAGLPSDTSIMLLLFENTWARKVGDAIENADGQVVMFERIPRPVVQDLIQEREELLAQQADA
jgi:hypothetical protein